MLLKSLTITIVVNDVGLIILLISHLFEYIDEYIYNEEITEALCSYQKSELNAH